jgi:hypothetical protein
MIYITCMKRNYVHRSDSINPSAGSICDMLQKLIIIISLLLVTVIWFGSAFANQKITGFMSGQIFDNDESTPIEGAKIILFHIKTGVEYSAVSSREGIYFLEDLIPGLYNVVIIFSNNEYKYSGQLFAEDHKNFFIKACWAIKHENRFAKLLDRECRTKQLVNWWKRREFLIIGGMASAAAGAALTLREENLASPINPCCNKKE